MTATITIPSGKDIVLIDDGQERTISPLPGKNVAQLFDVKAGGTLTFDSTEEGGLVFPEAKAAEASREISSMCRERSV